MENLLRRMGWDGRKSLGRLVFRRKRLFHDIMITEEKDPWG